MSFHVVTGAYGYTGRYIAQRLLDRGTDVQTLTNSPHRMNPFRGRVEASPLAFEHPQQLVEALRGAEVLYNTYWVRFNYKNFNHRQAVENSRVLFEAAKRAGVRRIVHVSITNPNIHSELSYFQGKAEVEDALMSSGLSYAILRPAVIFGREDILINNIAWVLRRFPVFGVFGDGEYRLQPIYVEDFAKLAVEQGLTQDDVIIDAIGVETFTFRELVTTIGDAIGKRRPIFPISPAIGYGIARLIGLLVGDVFLTRDEIEGLMRNLLYTSSPAVGETRLSQWAYENADRLGIHYANELARRRDDQKVYKRH